MKLLILIFILQVFRCITVICVNIGDSCQITSKDGKCKHIKKCPQVLEAYQRHRVQPTFCDRATRSICCPNPEVIESRFQSERISAKSEFYFRDKLQYRK